MISFFVSPRRTLTLFLFFWKLCNQKFMICSNTRTNFSLRVFEKPFDYWLGGSSKTHTISKDSIFDNNLLNTVALCFLPSMSKFCPDTSYASYSCLIFCESCRSLTFPGIRLEEQSLVSFSPTVGTWTRSMSQTTNWARKFRRSFGHHARAWQGLILVATIWLEVCPQDHLTITAFPVSRSCHWATTTLQER